MNPWWKRTEDSTTSSKENPTSGVTPETPEKSPAPEAAEGLAAKADSPDALTAEPEAEEKPRARRRRPARKKADADGEGDAAKAASVADDEKPPPAAKESDEASESATATGDDEAATESRPRARRRSPRRKTAAEDDGAKTEEAPRRSRSASRTRDKDDDDERESKPARRSRRSRSRTPKPSEDVQPQISAKPADAVVSSPDVLDLLRESLSDVPNPSSHTTDERRIALFFDFENIALGIKDSDIPKLDLDLLLERLLEKGKIIVKKAYADWDRYSEFKRTLHSAAIELIEIPQKSISGKNSADIKLVVDAMELSAQNPHLDTFVFLSGDSDFSPLVSKLRENNKHVIGVGVKNSSSKLLIDNCDEFIFYEDIWRDSQQTPRLEGMDKKKQEVFSLMTDSIHALMRENKDVLWGSMVKQTMQRKRPSFNEGYFGYGSFSELLEDAAERNILNLKKDHRSGSYIVTGFAKQA